MSNGNQKENKSLPPFAVGLVAIGGGVVGYDYGTALEVSPAIGAAIGAGISSIAVAILNYLMRDPENKIKDIFMGFGLISGLIFALYTASENDLELGPGAILCVICGGIGTWLGSQAAALLSYAAFLLLFMSQGPVGFFIRSIILNSN